MKTAPPLQKSIWTDLLHYLAPHLCVGCSEPIATESPLLCQSCRYSIDPAPYPEELFNTLWGDLPRSPVSITSVGSLFRFRQDSAIQRLIHAIKYQGCRGLAREIGHELGATLSIFPEFHDFDLLVPVPLHHSRERERGYNQAAEIAKGAGQFYGVPVETKIVERAVHTRSQTRLGRHDRRSNVSNVFRASDSSLTGARVVLVDDVLTTGATLQAVAEQILLSGASEVSAMTIAFDDITLASANSPTFTFDFQ